MYLLEIISPLWTGGAGRDTKSLHPTCLSSPFPSPPCHHPLPPLPLLFPPLSLPFYAIHFLISSSLPSSPHPLPHTSRGGLVAAFLWVIVGSNPHALHEHWSELGLSDLRSESRNINERLSQHKQNWAQFLCLFPTERHTDGFVTVWCNEW